MEIVEIKTRKKDYLSLLLLADEQESMIDRYLDRGTMFVLMDDGVKAECVVTDEGNGIMEIKNIATEPAYQGMGYGRSLIDFVAEKYRGQYSILQVGTGDSPLTIPFYERCGFVRSHIVSNFFVEHYEHPIYEGGKQLIDMVYRRLLASCYRSCLEMAQQNGIGSVAFCCISTGEFHFPNQEAAKIAVETVRQYKGDTEVIFNVFRDVDDKIYREYLG